MKRTSIALFLILGLCAITAFGQKKEALKDRHATAVAEIAAAERAFAKRCGEIGVRDSFLEYFTDDCTIFIPEPTNAKAFYGKRKPGKGPFELVWGPEFVDASNAGDMGYSTGPSVFSNPTDPKFKPNYGYYFSIWKKQPDGSWKVVIDVGTNVPQGNPIPKDVEAGRFISSNDAIPRTPNFSGFNKLIQDRETEFIREVAAKGPEKAYSKSISDQFRRHFPGMMPSKGGDSLTSHLSQRSEVKMGLTRFESSNGGDLFYSYGEYAATVDTGKEKKAETGFYFHVWKMEGKSLKLAAEVINLKE
jgi:ketosteroid isomerase-like protein